MKLNKKKCERKSLYSFCFYVLFAFFMALFAHILWGGNTSQRNWLAQKKYFRMSEETVAAWRQSWSYITSITIHLFIKPARSMGFWSTSRAFERTSWAFKRTSRDLNRDRDQSRSRSRSFLVPMIGTGPGPGNFLSQWLVTVTVPF